ncbi:MAG TPA: GntR family transcriptional regulator [Galbitalea sp.]|jgi:DNA-binding GntR family transcriptional regulator|nr:GntR family transcriptional regulator [Galbitalea sp.]
MAGTAVPPLARRDPTPAAFELIRDSILDGTAEPGSPLVELTLAQLYGVSRTPIREALTRLEQAGLVARTSRGLVVRERSPEEILDIYEARIVLEAKVAEVAANRRNEFDTARIQAALRACDEADPAQPSELMRVNDLFHQTIWAASHNDTLTRLLDQLRMHLARYPATTLGHGDRWKEALAEHHAIASAIIAGKADRAHKATADHFTRAREIRMELWRLGIS